MSVLEGITVLDFSRGLAGSICTLQLADAGADVIKVEPLSGDPLRQWGAKTGERSALFLTLNRDKRSLAIDYDDPQVYPVLLKMIERADVVVEDFEPSHAQAKKLTYEEFKAVNETLIHCCITPYGQSGPYAGLPASELEIQGLTGHMGFLGQAGKAPVRVGADIAEVGAAMHAFIGIASALFWRMTSGRGQKVEISLAGALLSLGSHWMADFSQPDDFAGGVMHPYEAPETGYRCKDRPITFGFLGRRTEKRDPWQDLCKALGLEELLEDSWMVEHGAGYVGVGRDAQEMKPLLENVIATRTSDEVLEIVHEIGGAGMPFMAYDELYGRPLHPQVEATEAIVEIRDPDGGSQRAILSPWAVGGSLGRRDHTVAPDLGADTDQILRGLGFDDDETGQLRKAGRIR